MIWCIQIWTNQRHWNILIECRLNLNWIYLFMVLPYSVAHEASYQHSQVSVSMLEIVRHRNSVVFGNYKNHCYVHDHCSFLSDMKNRWQIVWNEKNFDHDDAIGVTLNITFYFQVYEKVAPGGRPISSICKRQNHISGFCMTNSEGKFKNDCPFYIMN